MRSTVSFAASRLISTQSTLAPSRANATAVALPFPQPWLIEPAPTTIAFLPFRRSDISFLPRLASMSRIGFEDSNVIIIAQCVYVIALVHIASEHRGLCRRSPTTAAVGDV